jgi:energy-coupling factor transport system ATP-binding protein
MEIINIKDYSFRYPGMEENILKNVDFSVKESEFVIVCGVSGCGKTTLLRNIKKEIAPLGECSGQIFYKGQSIEEISERESARNIGFVMQNPENQIVTDKVWHELAFGLENLGVDTEIIRRRVAETANYFGINHWFEKSVHELSGGQKQLLNLASIVVMQPELIILDEPTSQLDPIAAKDFLTVLQRINYELGTTVVITEHRLEDIFPMADKVLYMDNGRIDFYGETEAFINHVADQQGHVFLKALPSATRIAIGLHGKAPYPVTVREGKQWLKEFSKHNNLMDKLEDFHKSDKKDDILLGKEIWFRYNKNSNYVLKGFTYSLKKEQLNAIVGGNGSGKSTALGVLSGLYKPVRGNVKLNGKKLKKIEYRKDGIDIGMLTQNPKSMFVYDTVYEDLEESAMTFSDKAEVNDKIMEISDFFRISHLLKKHPYDLSGGEQQKAAIAKILLLNPSVLLMDEPTKALDPYSKEELAEMLNNRCASGDSILMVTHDIEFSATYADTCAMMFNGDIVCTDDAKAFFEGNNFYTTSANRITRGFDGDGVTCKDVIDEWQIN